MKAKESKKLLTRVKEFAQNSTSYVRTNAKPIALGVLAGGAALKGYDLVTKPSASDYDRVAQAVVEKVRDQMPLQQYSGRSFQPIPGVNVNLNLDLGSLVLGAKDLLSDPETLKNELSDENLARYADSVVLIMEAARDTNKIENLLSGAMYRRAEFYYESAKIHVRNSEGYSNQGNTQDALRELDEAREDNARAKRLTRLIR